MDNRQPGRNFILGVTLVATALAMGGALAHALELPNKIGLPQDAYFTVQQIYSGWNRLAFLLLVELIGMIAVIAMHRHERRVAIPAVTALAWLIAAQVIFWLFTFPANRATANWTVQPANWEALRWQWEYSHLGGFVCQFGAFVALTIAALSRRGNVQC